jgi:hypothetical protein
MPSWTNTLGKLLLKGVIYWGIGAMIFAGFVLGYCLLVIGSVWFEPFVEPIKEYSAKILMYVVLPLCVGWLVYDVDEVKEDDDEDPL